MSRMLGVELGRAGACMAAVVLLATSGVVSAGTKYWNGAGTWTGANTWSLTSGGPYNQTWASGDQAIFDVAASTVTFASTSVTNIIANQSVTLTAAGTMTTGGTQLPIFVANGMTLNLAGQGISTAAGTGVNKSGPGALFSSNGNGYTGGFVISAGYMIIGGVNAMGAGTGHSLTLNGGALGVNGNRTLSNKFPAGITVGGDIQLGVFNATVALANDTATLTFNDNGWALGAATRTLTVGANGTYTIGGVISGAAGTGLTIAGLPTATGAIAITNAATITGDLTVNSGTLRLSLNGGFATAPYIVFGNAGGTLDVTGLTTALTLASGQGLKFTGSAVTATNVVAAGKGLTTAANSTLTFTAFTNSVPPLRVAGTGGSFTLSSANAVTVTVAQAGTPLAAGDYKLIATNNAGATVAGSAPASVTVNGDGAVGTASLVLSANELYLHVDAAVTTTTTSTTSSTSTTASGTTSTTSTSSTSTTSTSTSSTSSTSTSTTSSTSTSALPPPANVFGVTTNITDFTAGWSAVSGATGYFLDVSTNPPPETTGATFVSDNFDDGNITGWTESTASRWAASTTSPINGTHSLKHTFVTASAGNDQISIPITGLNVNTVTTTWRFQLKHGIAPSSNNSWAYYLLSDQAASQMTPAGTANGYAVAVNFTGTDDLIKILRIDAGVPTTVLATSTNWETMIGTSQAVGIEVQRTSSGEWSIKLDTNGGFDGLTAAGTPAVDTTHSTASYSGAYFKYSATGDQLLWVDDITISQAAYLWDYVSGYSNRAVAATSEVVTNLAASTPYYFRVRTTDGVVTSANSVTGSVTTLSYDADTVADDPTSQVAGGTVSSLSTNEALAEDVFSFDITDSGALDGLPTHVTQITIKPDAGNTASWATNLAGVVLKSGTAALPATSTNISDAAIVFSLAAGLLDVADGTSSNLTLAVYLKTTNVNDGAVLDFKVDSGSHGFTATPSGSTFAGTFGGDVSGNNQTIDIAASRLILTTVPTHVATNRSFTVRVRAEDAGGQRDLDSVHSVSIVQTSGGGTLLGGGAQALVQGTNTWLLTYDALDAFSILATNTSLAGAAASITGGTGLAAGDIQIVGYNSDNPDGFAFVTWTALAAGTHVMFTDAGWSNTVFRTGIGEGSVLWAATASVPVGTVVLVTNDSGGTAYADQGTIIGATTLNLAAGADQIFALQGTVAEPTLLFGLDFAGAAGWDAHADSTSTSGQPGALSAATANFAPAASDNGQYTATRTGPVATLQNNVVTSGNWGFSGTPVVLNSTDFTVSETIAFTASSASVSEGAGSTTFDIAITGSANVTATVAVVSGSASFGSDFTLSSTTLVFTAGGLLTNTLTIFLTDDLFVEGSETATLQLHNIIGVNPGSPTNFVLTITDNDGVLAAGDLAIIGMDDTTDDFVLVALADIAGGTVIYITDNGWITGTGFRGGSLTDGDGNEQLAMLTFNSTVPKGTIIRSDMLSLAYTFAFSGAIPGGSGETFSLPAQPGAGADEQLYLFQAPTTNPIVSVNNNIFVLDDSGAFEDATTANTGTNSPGTTVGSTAITIDFGVASSYGLDMGAASALFHATKAEWLTYIANSNNWVTGTIPGANGKLWFTPPQTVFGFE